MVCEHLRQLEEEMLAAGFSVTFRGRPWSRNCREWVYFDCYIDREAIQRRLALHPCVEAHEHLGTHDGQESGFVCSKCKDGIMGVHGQQRRESTRVHR